MAYKSTEPKAIDHHKRNLYEIEEDLAFSPPQAFPGAPLCAVPVARSKHKLYQNLADLESSPKFTIEKQDSDISLQFSPTSPVPPTPPPIPPVSNTPPGLTGASWFGGSLPFESFKSELERKRNTSGGSMKRHVYAEAADPTSELKQFSKHVRSLPPSPHSSPSSSPKLVRRSSSSALTPMVWQAAAEGAVEYAVLANDPKTELAKDPQDRQHRSFFGIPGLVPLTAPKQRGESLTEKLGKQLGTMNEPFIDHRKKLTSNQTKGRCAITGTDLNIMAPTGM